MNTGKIPLSMKNEKRWLLWNWRSSRGRSTKTPIRGAKSNDPTTWIDFATAVDLLKHGNGHGIAFALGGDWVGLDFDDCYMDGIFTDDRVEKYVKEFDTYTEISPSETGIKMICRGQKPGDKCKKDGVEIYSDGRFFTVTGMAIHGTEVHNRQVQIDTLYHRVFGAKTGSKALNAMLKIGTPAGENDGSKRLFTVCCRAVEHNLTDDETIATIRQYESQRPFPASFDDAEIITRLRDAEKRATRFPHCTDTGNAERMANLHGDDLRHVGKWDKWLAFDNRRWLVDDNGQAVERAKQTALSIHNEAAQASGDLAEQLKKWASISEAARQIRAMLFLAESQKPFPISHDKLDAEPFLLNCEDGTIDLQTGELREHRREDLLTKCCACGYSTDPPVKWLKFLDEILTAELVSFIQRLLGCALVGETREHILPILYGSGGNGKSVLISTVLGLMGDYGGKGHIDLVTSAGSHPTAVADLFGKRIVAISEIEDNAILAEARVKDITGGEPITARRMREDFWQFRPSHTLLVSTNHRPTIRGTDHGIWRRVLLIPFDYQVPADKIVKDLPRKLEAEWPQILGWLVQGCIEWQKNGLQVPESVRAATAEYSADMDALAIFVAEKCQPGGEIKASVLYGLYKEWATNSGEPLLTATKFGRAMKTRYQADPRKDATYYVGLKAA